MSHQGLTVKKAVGFGHGEVGVVNAAKIIQIGIPYPGIPFHLLAYIASHPDAFLVSKRLDSSAFHGADVNVKVGHPVAPDDISKKLDGVGLCERVLRARIVHQAHILIQRHGNIFGSEFLWRHLAVPMELVIFVTPLPDKARGRCS